ncbi:hypothetical protein ABKV19_024523 [Rosa sericea]
MIRPHARRLNEKKKRYHPVAGTILNQLINVPRLHHYMTELACKYRTYRLLGFFRSEVYTSDAANVEYMLKTNFANYGKGLYHYNILSDLVGDGIFAVDGEKWQQQRASSSEFSTNMLRDFGSGIFKINAVKLAGIIYEAVTCDRAIEIQVSSNVQQSYSIFFFFVATLFCCLFEKINKSMLVDLFMKSSLDSIIKILLDIELDTMCGTNEEGIRFSNAFDEANEITLYQYVDSFWKVKRFLNIGSEAVLRNNIKVVDQFVYKLINKKLETVHSSEDESTLKKRDFISRLLELRETDPKYLKDMILNFIVAGKDTVATNLSWFLYVLCKHRHIQKKIAQEVREATSLNNSSSIDELATSLTEEALDKMQHLHAALTETLRLYPAVPVDAKVCFSEDTWPDGFTVQKGDMVPWWHTNLMPWAG